VKKSEKPRLWAKQTFSFDPAFQSLGSFSDMVACRSSLEDTRKMNLIPILNKTSPRAHTESEFDIFGVNGKLVKYVVHSFKRKN
jgi:hypothetical protein